MHLRVRFLLVVLLGLLPLPSLTHAQPGRTAPGGTAGPRPATTLPMPRELQRAYERGTRDFNGAPGPNYFAHGISYEIEARLDAAAARIAGREHVTFTNRAPDTLRTLAVKLYQNVYRPGAVHALELEAAALTSGMRIERLDIDGVPALSARELAELPDTIAESPYAIGGGGFAPGAHVQRHGTTWLVRLPAPLAPGAVLTIDATWSFPLPDARLFPNRMGMLDDSAVFIGSWYPKIAVHDDIRGWDLAPYDDWHEFHHAFADYSVAVTAPATFGVWCTGELENPGEVLAPHILARWHEAARSDSVVHVVRTEDRGSWTRTTPAGPSIGGTMAEESATGATTTGATTTWRFRASHVSDVAFAASPLHVWDAASLEVAPGRRVRVSAVYRPDAGEGFRRAAAEARATIHHLSTRMPGIPYPFPAITVFQGVEGMEYPMIVNDGDFGSRVTDVYVHSHEISHQYFPFMVGTNEYLHAWMDEGMAYFLPIEVQTSLAGYDHRLRAVSTYSRFAGREADLPLMIPTTASVSDDFMILCYQKSSVAFMMLEQLLGGELFSRALRTFITRWEGRNPTPWDFFHTFNNVSGRDLAWFWKPWFFEYGAVPDLTIIAVTPKGAELDVRLRRTGGMPVPVVLRAIDADGTVHEAERPASVWEHGEDDIIISLPAAASATRVDLGSKLIPDANSADNTWRK